METIILEKMKMIYGIFKKGKLTKLLEIIIKYLFV